MAAKRDKIQRDTREELEDLITKFRKDWPRAERYWSGITEKVDINGEVFYEVHYTEYH